LEYLDTGTNDNNTEYNEKAFEDPKKTDEPSGNGSGSSNTGYQYTEDLYGNKQILPIYHDDRNCVQKTGTGYEPLDLLNQAISSINQASGFGTVDSTVSSSDPTGLDYNGMPSGVQSSLEGHGTISSHSGSSGFSGSGGTAAGNGMPSNVQAAFEAQQKALSANTKIGFGDLAFRVNFDIKVGVGLSAGLGKNAKAGVDLGSIGHRFSSDNKNSGDFVSMGLGALFGGFGFEGPNIEGAANISTLAFSGFNIGIFNFNTNSVSIGVSAQAVIGLGVDFEVYRK
jgi:hypothetical protein